MAFHGAGTESVALVVSGYTEDFHGVGAAMGVHVITARQDHPALFMRVPIERFGAIGCRLRFSAAVSIA